MITELQKESLKELGFKLYKNYFRAYKVFGYHYESPDSWNIKPGSTIKEKCDFSIFERCSRGINVGTLEWCDDFFYRCSSEKLYQIHVPYTANICIPHRSGGKIRTDKAKIIKVFKVY